VKFEPFILYSYSVGPSIIHSARGEFLPATGAQGGNPQLAAMGMTLESMRNHFAASIMFLEGNPVPRLPGVPQVGFESRYVMGQHNGQLVDYRPTLLNLLEVSNLDRTTFAGLVSASVDAHVGAATFFSREALRIDRLKEAFKDAGSLESLRLKLLSTITVFLGFDHDAFFTLESRDADFVEEVLRSARLERKREPSQRGHG